MWVSDYIHLMKVNSNAIRICEIRGLDAQKYKDKNIFLNEIMVHGYSCLLLRCSCGFTEDYIIYKVYDDVQCVECEAMMKIDDCTI